MEGAERNVPSTMALMPSLTATVKEFSFSRVRQMRAFSSKSMSLVMDRGEGDVPDGDVVLFPIDVGLGVLREGLNGTEAGHLAEEVEGLDLGMRSVRGAYLLVLGIEPLLGLLLVGGKDGEGGEELLEVDLVVLVDGASLVEDASEGGGDDGEEGAEGGEDAVVDAGDVGVEDAVGGLVDVEAVGAAGDVEDHVLLGGDLRGGGEGGAHTWR